MTTPTTQRTKAKPVKRKPPPPRLKILRDYVKSVGGQKKAGKLLGYSINTIATYMYDKASIPKDICDKLGIEYIEKRAEHYTEQTAEFQKYIDYVGGKDIAAKRLQISLNYLNQMLNNRVGRGVLIAPIVAERAELDSDGYVSKVKMVFAAPSVYRGDDQPVRKLGDPIRCPS